MYERKAKATPNAQCYLIEEHDAGLVGAGTGKYCTNIALTLADVPADTHCLRTEHTFVEQKGKAVAKMADVHVDKLWSFHTEKMTARLRSNCFSQQRLARARGAIQQNTAPAPAAGNHGSRWSDDVQDFSLCCVEAADVRPGHVGDGRGPDGA